MTKNEAFIYRAIFVFILGSSVGHSLLGFWFISTLDQLPDGGDLPLWQKIISLFSMDGKLLAPDNKVMAFLIATGMWAYLEFSLLSFVKNFIGPDRDGEIHI